MTLWCIRHFKVVERIIGGEVIGTQGTPVELLGKLIHNRMYPGALGGSERADRAGEARGLVPLPAIHAGFWPAITLRQSRPSLLPRRPALAANECGLWLGAHKPEARQHHWKAH